MRTKGASCVLVASIAVTLVVIYLAPTIYSVCLSFDILAVPRVANAPNTRWYTAIFDDERLTGALLRSCWISLSVAALTALACLAAFADFHRYPESLKRALLGLILLPLFVPETTHALTLSDFLSHSGLTLGWWCIVIGEAVYVMPFIGIVLVLRIADIPPNIEFAARDIGIGSLRRALHITIPLTWLTAVFAIIFAFLLSFNEYSRAAYFEAREMYAVYLRGNLTGGGGQSVYAVSTTMFVLGIIVLILVVWLPRTEER